MFVFDTKPSLQLGGLLLLLHLFLWRLGRPLPGRVIPGPIQLQRAQAGLLRRARKEKE